MDQNENRLMLACEKKKSNRKKNDEEEEEEEVEASIQTEKNDCHHENYVSELACIGFSIGIFW